MAVAGKQFASEIEYPRHSETSLRGRCGHGMNLPKAEAFESVWTWITIISRQSFVRARSWALSEFKEGRIQYTRSRAEKGDPTSEYRLGLFYESGEHGQQSYYEAHKWFLRAAFHGLAAAQAKVCEFNREGRGVPRNDEEAFRWCRKAAEQGHALSQFRLVEMYREGIGVERNPKEAKKWEDKVSTRKIPTEAAPSQQLSAVSR